MSYEIYKILHVNALFLTLCAVGMIFANSDYVQKKVFKIIVHTISLLIFVAGMGLIARIGIKHGEGFPSWIIVKMVAWFIFTMALVLGFKVKDKTSKIICVAVSLICAFIASYAAITKFL